MFKLCSTTLDYSRLHLTVLDWVFKRSWSLLDSKIEHSRVKSRERLNGALEFLSFKAFAKSNIAFQCSAYKTLRWLSSDSFNSSAAYYDVSLSAVLSDYICLTLNCIFRQKQYWQSFTNVNEIGRKIWKRAFTNEDSPHIIISFPVMYASTILQARTRFISRGLS